MFDRDIYTCDYLDRYWIYADLLEVASQLRGHLVATEFQAEEIQGHEQELLSSLSAIILACAKSLARLEANTKINRD